jgi:hypothetical protein
MDVCSLLGRALAARGKKIYMISNSLSSRFAPGGVSISLDDLEALVG